MAAEVVEEHLARSLRRLESHELHRRNRPRESLEGEGRELFELPDVFQLRRQARRGEDLAGFRLAAETRGEVGHRTDGAVVPAALESDPADRGEPLGDSDP